MSNDFAIVNLSHLTILRVTQITLTLSMSKTILYFFVRENVTSNKYLYNLPQINEWVFVWFFLLGGGGFVWFFFQFVCLFVCLSFKLFMLTLLKFCAKHVQQLRLSVRYQTSEV